ncbi:MAG: hypothetical protein K0U37_04355 [Gammaproteobacteria bacterium]|nr:hypothetical protein [Gammaproteobacteria bacterium]
MPGKPIHAVSFDMDGAIFNTRQYHHLKEKDDNAVVNSNQTLLVKIRENSANYAETIVFVGSNRQDYDHDQLNSERNETEPCFSAIQKLSTALDARLDPFLLADVYRETNKGFEPGYAFGLTQRRDVEGLNHPRWIFDETKATILYAQMHKLANEHPNETIEFDFFDDRADILISLHDFYTNHPDLVPTNVTLHLNHYLGDKPKCVSTLKGTGMIDQNYVATTKKMGTVAKKLYDRKKGPKSKHLCVSETLVEENDNFAEYLPRQALTPPSPIIPITPPRSAAFESLTQLIEKGILQLPATPKPVFQKKWDKGAAKDLASCIGKLTAGEDNLSFRDYQSFIKENGELAQSEAFSQLREKLIDPRLVIINDFIENGLLTLPETLTTIAQIKSKTPNISKIIKSLTAGTNKMSEVAFDELARQIPELNTPKLRAKIITVTPEPSTSTASITQGFRAKLSEIRPTTTSPLVKNEQSKEDKRSDEADTPQLH